MEERRMKNFLHGINISIVMILLTVTGCVAQEKTLVTDNEFTLLSGQGVEVCDAYLNRLNTSKFENDWPPYCDRPEVFKSNGFEKLNRVNLSSKEIYKIYDRVLSFQQRTNQMYSEKIRKRSYLSKNKDEAINSIEFKRNLKRLYVWRYDPMVDVDNDGELDNVVLWHRQHRRACGSISGVGKYFPSYYAYIFNKKTTKIDEKKTLEVFGHPVQERPNAPTLKRFRSYNDESSVGVFKYKGTTYFDTFPNGLTYGSDIHHEIDLRVYLRKNNQTKTVCEYHWNKRVKQ